ncbi:Flp family type IVb pilin [Pendulispora rubella]|uniref:Flp family type IVb pilin n=2 Tax=Pendulispora TaxID=3375062 RepID=A0ABZ2LH51_9BACT
MNKDIMQLVKDEKGATAIEYGLLLVAILLIVAGAYKKLGKAVKGAANDAKGEF